MESKAKSSGRKSEQTRSRILDSAIELFNEAGTNAVNTHDIARRAGVSPGNVYYHFANKSEIIREIFARMELYSPDRWPIEAPIDEQVSFLDTAVFFFGGFIKYRFFFREFSLLLHADPILATQWRQTFLTLIEGLRRRVDNLVQIGVLKKFESQEAIDGFIDNTWMIANFASVHLEAKLGKPADRLSERAAELLISYFAPYHTEKGKQLLDNFVRLRINGEPAATGLNLPAPRAPEKAFATETSRPNPI